MTNHKIWFTSDIHFSHKSLITRPKVRPKWESVEEMDAAIIKNWNERVAFRDEVYILGDVAICSAKRADEFLGQLNGRKYLIAGNHDKGLIKKAEFNQHFEWIKDLYTVKIQDPDAPRGVQRIVLFHYAMLIWDQAHYGAWHLHGHSHGNLKVDLSVKRLDVGMDCHDFFPIDYTTIKQTMKYRDEWQAIDHHIPEV